MNGNPQVTWRCGTKFIKDNKKLNNWSLNNSVVPNSYIIAKGDSGASRHCFALEEKEKLQNVKFIQGPEIKLPNDSTIKTTATGNIPIKNLSNNATKTYLLKDLNNIHIFPLCQLCDNGCHILLKKKKLYVCKKKDLLLQGYRNHADGLWDITLTQKIPIKINALIFQKNQIKDKKFASLPLKNVINVINAKLNVIIHKNSTKNELSTYLHACCFCPTKATFMKAIQNGFFFIMARFDRELNL